MADALFSFSPTELQSIPASEVGRVPAFDFDERGRGAFWLVDILRDIFYFLPLSICI